MYKGKSFGTPFKKRWMGVRCFVAFEIRFGSYRVSPAQPGEKFCATFCRTYYILHTTCSCIQYVVPRRGCDILSQLDVVCCIYTTQYVVPPKGVRHIVTLTTIYLTQNNQQLFVLVQML
jgi:hypothetical protein